MKEKQLRWKWKDTTSLYVSLISMCWVTEANHCLENEYTSFWREVWHPYHERDWWDGSSHERFQNLSIQIKYPLADHLMNFFSQQSKNTNDFFYCDSWSKELFRECFMKFRNFSCSTKLLPGFLKVAVDISCFIKGCDSWMDWLYVNYCELDCCVLFKSLPLFISELN